MAPLSQHPRQQRGMSFAARAAAIPPADGQLCSILFDFDGTLGDTETPAMQVSLQKWCKIQLTDRAVCSLYFSLPIAHSPCTSAA
jgi:hypothetical protein